MKKLIALFMAIVMVMGMVACGGGNNDNPTDAATTTTPATEPVVETTEATPLTNAERYPLDTDTVLRVLFTEDGLGDTDASNLWTEVTGVEIENLEQRADDDFSGFWRYPRCNHHALELC